MTSEAKYALSRYLLPNEGWAYWRPFWIRTVVVLIVALVGIRFWPAVDWLLPLSGLMMLTFTLGRFPRAWGYVTFAVFYLAESFPLVSAGVAIMGTDLRTSVMLWMLHGLTSSLPILLLRGAAPGFRAALVAFLYIVPPFGIFVPNNPATVIGLFFPGTGLFGVLGIVALAGAIGGFDKGSKVNVRSLVTLIVLSVVANAVAIVSMNSAPSNWHTFDTQVGKHGSDLRRRMDVANLELPVMLKNELSKATTKHNSEIWFFAEGMIYDWLPITDFLWNEALKGTGVTAVVGGYEFNEKTSDATSRVYLLGDSVGIGQAKSALDPARASMTFPIAMWRPWGRPNHFPMHPPGSPVLLDGKRVHISWCYESTIVWPHIMAAIQAPDVMVSLENRWSTQGTTLEAAQTAAGTLNARWLGVPILRAINR